MVLAVFHWYLTLILQYSAKMVNCLKQIQSRRELGIVLVMFPLFGSLLGMCFVRVLTHIYLCAVCNILHRTAFGMLKTFLRFCLNSTASPILTDLQAC